MKNDELDALLFVDTNIYLDFYRSRKSDVSLKFLKTLEECKQRLILTSQVEMEYKKNRQSVILDSLNKFSMQNINIETPAILSDHKALEMIEKQKKQTKAQYNKLNLKIQKILSSPVTSDKVYQTLQRIFKHKSSYNLDRESEERVEIRELANKRFMLGYPPRKKDDTSIGDAVNWEWIVKCAIDSGKDIVIVTRDTDFGVIYKDNSYLNDWLVQEFNKRVSQKRKIILTNKLSVGLKHIHAIVTKEMEEEEAYIEQVIASQNDFDESYQDNF